MIQNGMKVSIDDDKPQQTSNDTPNEEEIENSPQNLINQDIN